MRKTYLHFRMVRGNTIPNKPEWYGKPFIHIYHSILDSRHHLIGCVKAGWP